MESTHRMWDRLVRIRLRKRWKPLTLWPSTLRRTPPTPSPEDVGVAPEVTAAHSAV